MADPLKNKGPFGAKFGAIYRPILLDGKKTFPHAKLLVKKGTDKAIPDAAKALDFFPRG